MTRVLIVDDSLTMRHHLREALAADPDLEIVGEAPDGERAVEMTARLRPDVITMDMMLPGISGLAATEQIMAQCPTPILVVSSADREELFTTYNALAAGAVEVMEKPRGDDSDADWPSRLRATLRLVSRIRVITHPRARLDGRVAAPPSPAPTPEPGPHGGLGLVAVGSSTGGPAALTEFLRGLPAGFRVPVLCVQHIAAGEQFAVAFSDWLAGQTGRDIRYADDGTPVGRLGGRVLLAPPDRHLLIRDRTLRLSTGPPRHSCRPSVDVLFESVAEEYGPRAAGCLLTGMGRDGAAGLLGMRGRGAVTFAQDEGSCAVYGMPREAALIGAAAHVLPPGRMAARLGDLQPTAVRR
ncbi:chemotaxis response regulator protein-glutamate methylesterase [Actinoplanes lobatus]|uniref:Protein-glutamate methylesterase/protein-glutamine glutaminase n=1 Tax=Actinoplanes lobatus TaxID=113568 RepID=A0A7W7HPZ8_9ACTN|nr:chemotaxis-specific protein-glutamate methyltransferase CheB [Actinoplanes lobatus]MBB4754525.1 two-component system chemotaxis response regulator CheB [Actinoplanes lobatus]GGN66091.1 chemotaxis response regulator protein-glutamate methylesterase [Actinoplanes lobatus]GIE40400.1 chemotaxis response regulator protein-glutamate methylesterase [Actinoplanes lobatus]